MMKEYKLTLSRYDPPTHRFVDCGDRRHCQECGESWITHPEGPNGERYIDLLFDLMERTG